MTGRGEYEVAVVGGGCAGIAAACCSARSGAKTVLIERQDVLGGNMSNAWVHTICGLYAEQAGELRYVNPGFPVFFARYLTRYGAAGSPERVGRVGVLPIYPERAATACTSLCASYGSLDVQLGTSLIRARLGAGERGEASLTIRRGGLVTEIRASIVIDTTGDAALAALGDAELLGSGADRVQAASLIFRVSGVQPGSLSGFSPLRLSAAVTGAVRHGALPAGCDSVLVRPGLELDAAYITLNLPDASALANNLIDESYVAQLMAEGRQRAELVLDFLRSGHPSFAGCTLAGWPRRVGVRETRRIRGQHVISEYEVLQGATTEDDVARSSWPIELWNDHRRAHFQYPSGACGIPLGALRSATCPELGMAGRCLSATRAALGALRVLGTALATGEAIGVAAGIAVTQKISLRKVTAGDVRRRILEGIDHDDHRPDIPIGA